MGDLQFPVKLAFAPDGRLFYSEQRTGNIRIITTEGDLLPEPFAHVDVVDSPVVGLFGLAFDPDFETNHYMYSFSINPSRETPDGIRAVVTRFTDANSRGLDPTVIFDLPHPGVTPHVAGNILFGPDGYLYVSLGDFGSAQFCCTHGEEDAQDLSSLRGKILRMNGENGAAPPDNPFVGTAASDPLVFAYGFRNPFDFTFHPETGLMYATENGTEFCDTLHIVLAGRNYGWPVPSSTEGAACQIGDVPPIYAFGLSGLNPETPGSNVAPTGVEFVSGDVYPALGDSLLVCEFNTGFMRRLVLAGPDQVVEDDVVAQGCHLDIAASPDGIIYYSNGDEIRRLLVDPVAEGPASP